MVNTLFSLPKELLLKIRSQIHSIQDNVHFSLVCRTAYKLYDDNFWRFACTTSGWSIKVMTPKASKAFTSAKAKKPATSIWAGLARVIIADEPTFKGYTDVTWTTQDDTVFEVDLVSFLELAPPSTVKKGQKLKIIEHGHLNCNFGKPIPKIFTINNYDDENWDYKNALPLLEHPFVANRIITSPAVSKVRLDDGKTSSNLVANNPDGLTVYDVHLALASSLKKVPKNHRSDHVFYEGFQAYGDVLSVCWGS